MNSMPGGGVMASTRGGGGGAGAVATATPGALRDACQRPGWKTHSSPRRDQYAWTYVSSGRGSIQRPGSQTKSPRSRFQ